MSAASFRRSQVFRNPDENFVLHGRSSSYWEKPIYLSNSQLTNSSARLSQHTQFNPDNYKDRHYVKSLGDLATNLGNLSEKFKHSLDKTVSFNDDLYSKRIKNHKNPIRSEELFQRPPNSSSLTFGGRPLNEDESEWFNRPSSLMSQKVINDDVYYRARYPSAGETEEEDVYTEEEKFQYPLSTRDSLSARYFPVTMSAPYELTFIDINVPSNKHSIRPKSAPRMSTSKSMFKKVSLANTSDVDKMYLMTSEAPTTGAAAKVITSPYQPEIARLRMERLRIEEDRLLELKRIEEIERIRGPNPKWYESKGTDFHYECNKNTEMMKHENHWEELVTYRNSLLNSSSDLRKSYEKLA